MYKNEITLKSIGEGHSQPSENRAITQPSKQAEPSQILALPSLKVWWLYVIGFLSLLIVKFIFFHEFEVFSAYWRIVVAIGILILGYLYLERITTIYNLNAIELTGREGVFSKTITRIPLNRITNYESQASFIERLLGLNNLLIDTPGGTGFELKLRQLNHIDAENISARLRQLLAQQKIADAGDNQELRSLRQQASAMPIGET
jgi:uncharacterized membrane protein YdbT with pleckstrin-like domain